MPFTFTGVQQPLEFDAPPYIVIADDIDVFRTRISRSFRDDGCFVIEVNNGAELFDLVVARHRLGEQGRLDLIISASGLLGHGGVALLLGLQAERLGIPSILLDRTGENRSLAFERGGGVIKLERNSPALSELRGLVAQLLEPVTSPAPKANRCLSCANRAMKYSQEFDANVLAPLDV